MTCEMCAWRGNSTELLELKDNGRFQDPRALVRFMNFLQKEISPVVGKALVQFGLITKDPTPENVAFITKVLVDYSRAGFEAVLKDLLRQGEDDDGAETIH